MEFLFVVTLGFFISWLYLNHAPMHDIKSAIHHAENIANQKQKFEKLDV